ncbi:hypothetical protein [Flaviaesturariibacter amylovorans]|uniref:Secreted protein n=1 Tax=Flaviaesturariibacter amylovorans TaxID=1084520 RepID=A0ABP8GVG5_9BACT
MYALLLRLTSDTGLAARMLEATIVAAARVWTASSVAPCARFRWLLGITLQVASASLSLSRSELLARLKPSLPTAG